MTSFPEETESPGLRAWRSLADTYRIVHAKVNSDLRQFGLTLPQYSLMRIVGKSESGSLEMNEIAKELLVTLANVTVIADNLEKRGYLKRVRGVRDRRVVRVELTPVGRALWKKISAAHRDRVTVLMRGLSVAELRELAAHADKVREKIQQAEDPSESLRTRGSQKSVDVRTSRSGSKGPVEGRGSGRENSH